MLLKSKLGRGIRTVIVLNATQPPRAPQRALLLSDRFFFFFPGARLGIQPSYRVLFFKLALPIDICSPRFSPQQRLMPVRLS